MIAMIMIATMERMKMKKSKYQLDDPIGQERNDKYQHIVSLEKLPKSNNSITKGLMMLKLNKNTTYSITKTKLMNICKVKQW